MKIGIGGKKCIGGKIGPSVPIYTITYHIDEGTSKSLKIIYNRSTLSPEFSPEKDGWRFVGWRLDDAANKDVIEQGETGSIAKSNLDLYAVFEQTITKTFVSYNSSVPVSNDRYYNNGNSTKAEIIVPKGASRTNWDWRGWSSVNNTLSNADVSFDNGDVMQGTTGGTYYGLYSATVTVTYNANGGSGSTDNSTGTKYYNASGDTKGASITLRSSGFTRSESAISLSWGGNPNNEAEGGGAFESYVFNGWDLGAVGGSVTLTENTTAVAQWRKTQLRIVYQNKHDDGNLNLPWAADSWASVNLKGFTKLELETETWTRDGCSEPNWRIVLNGSQITTIGGNELKTVNIGNYGTCTLRLWHEEVEYVDGYSHGKSKVYLTFT